MNKSGFQSAAKRLITITAVLGCASLLLPGAVQSQSLDLQESVSHIRTWFQQLDQLAENCLHEPATGCQAFTESLDRELGPYLDACEPLLAWRDALVRQHTNTPVTTDVTTTQQLLDVEFACGENALLKQTSHVQQAFNMTQQAALSVSASALATLNFSLSQQQASEQQARLRQSILGGVQNQNQRLNNEIEQQWRRIELENLREQNRRPLDFGNFPSPTGN